LLPLWSRELARGLTRQQTARRCRLSKLASGKAVASYRTPKRFAHFHAVPSATSNLNSNSPGSPTRPGPFTAKGCDIGCAVPFRARRHTRQAWDQVLHRRHLSAALLATWRCLLLTESLLPGFVGTPAPGGTGMAYVRPLVIVAPKGNETKIRLPSGNHPSFTSAVKLATLSVRPKRARIHFFSHKPQTQRRGLRYFAVVSPKFVDEVRGWEDRRGT